MKIFSSYVTAALVVIAFSTPSFSANRKLKNKFLCDPSETQMLAEENILQAELQNYEFGFDPVSNAYVTPTKRLGVNEYPVFTDDLSFKDLELAIERQLARYRQINMKHTIKFGNDVYPVTQIEKTLVAMRALVGEFQSCVKTNKESVCMNHFNSKVKEQFNVYAPLLQEGDPRYGEEKETLFTAYYTPYIKGSDVKTSTYKHAIFKKPSQATDAKRSRVEIDFDGKLNGKNLEIIYADNLFDLYLLHVQGGGHIEFSDKKENAYISYDGTNGQSWNFISKYMIEKKMIKNGSISAQRDYLAKNPGKQREVYGSCPSYVYFKTTSTPPLGSDVVPLTDGRSIATDRNFYSFKGVLSFVSAARPREDQSFDFCANAVEYMPFQRFFLDQDTGGAIKGRGRVDLYFGEGKYAELAAYNTTHKGNLYFLVVKN